MFRMDKTTSGDRFKSLTENWMDYEISSRPCLRIRPNPPNPSAANDTEEAADIVCLMIKRMVPLSHRVVVELLLNPCMSPATEASS